MTTGRLERMGCRDSGGLSEHLADHHRGEGGEEGDAEGREGVLSLCHRKAGDDTGTQAGDDDLSGGGGTIHVDGHD
ncbi:hypothetical protein BBFGKLBO_01476 [Synechococcus sp. CBW1107]|nr:hypothetical protein BBFGKLBO_01476 [Synechococcus sp. CBW1107]